AGLCKPHFAFGRTLSRRSGAIPVDSLDNCAVSVAPPQKAEASESDQRDDPGALQRPIPTQEHVYKQDRPGKDQRENGPQLPGEGVWTLRLVFHRIHLHIPLNTDTKSDSGAK